MALQVWLPLNGNINNQGLSGITMTGSPNSWDSNGKIGKCATFTGSTSNVIYNNTTDFNYTDNFSYCMWINHNYTGSAVQWAFTNGRADAGGYGYGIQIVNTSSIKCWFGNRSVSISCPTNEWHHIAFTISGTTIKVYKDGLLYSTNTTATLPTYSDGNGLGIGCFHFTSNIYPYYGSLNDFRIYDHCLSAKEVSEIAKGLVLHYRLSGLGADNLLLNTNQGTDCWGFNLGNQWIQPTKENVKWLGVDAFKATTNGQNDSYTTNWRLIYYNDNNLYKILNPNTQYTISFDSTIKHTSLSITQSNGTNTLGRCSLISEDRIDENEEIYYHLKGTFTTASTFSGSGQYVYIGSNMGYLDTAGNIVKYANIKLEEGSVATPWIPNSADTLYSAMGLNSTTEYDCSGLGNNSTKSGTIACESDSPRYMTSYKFNGNSCIKNNQFYFESPIWTVSLWYKYNTAPTAYEGLISLSKNDGSDSNKKIAIMANSNQIWFKTENISISIPSLKVGEWCHLAAVSDGTSAIIYENGVRKASTTISSFVTKAYDLVVGARSSSAGATTTSFYSKGNISDVRIYATALSADDIKQLYNTPISVDKTGNLYAYEFKEG